MSAALERVGALRGSIMITTQDGRALEVVVSVGIPDEDAKTVVAIGSGISGWVAQHARPLLIENIRQNPGIIEVSRRLRDPSFISVPLEHKHPSKIGEHVPSVEMPRVLGVINVNEKKSRGQFSEGDLKILSIVANHTAAALENVRLINDVQDAHLATLQSMALLLEAKDAYTHGHSERVRDYSVLVARKMGLSQQETEVLRVSAALHDVGKIGVKDAILDKCGPLTPDEWAMIRRHPKLGYDVLSHVPHLTKEHLQVVRGHHERIDGTGYPDRLQGDQLAAITQIIVVADAYDAMASDRAYRPALTREKIVEQIRRFAGSQFDPHVANVFLELIERGELRP
ncbi:MAG: HD domain-containing protein [Candidatus Hydrogenedentes bacterium]|nr:HD domain-containing protein [Candidatus Hydrogenedentota bacterium]